MADPVLDPTMGAAPEEDTRTWETGYQEAVSGLQSRMGAMPPAGAGISPQMLQQAMLMPSPMQKEMEDKEPSRWWYLLPGFAKGYADAKRLKQESERVKLERQRLAGQEATEKLKRAEMVNKLQEREALAKSMKAYGALKRYGGEKNIDGKPMLDDESKRELQGMTLEGLAGTGDVDAVSKFIEAETSAERAERFDAWQKARENAQAQPVLAPTAPSTAQAAPAQATPAGTNLPESYTKHALRAQIDAAVAAAAKATGLDPAEIYGIMAAESNFDVNAVSTILDKKTGKRLPGAIGLMQLMPKTAEGLKVNPYDLAQNVMGGAREYARLKAKYKDPRLALAAYNAGETRVEQYGGVPPFKETEGFIPRVQRNMARFGYGQAPAAGASPSAPARPGVIGQAAPVPPDPRQSPTDQEKAAFARDMAEHLQKQQRLTLLTRHIEEAQKSRAPDAGARLDALKDERVTVQAQMTELNRRLTTINPATGRPAAYETPAQTAAAPAPGQPPAQTQTTPGAGQTPQAASGAPAQAPAPQALHLAEEAQQSDLKELGAKRKAIAEIDAYLRQTQSHVDKGSQTRSEALRAERKFLDDDAEYLRKRLTEKNERGQLKAYLTPEIIAAGDAAKDARELAQHREKKRIDDEMEDPSIKRNRDLEGQRKTQEIGANTPEAKEAERRRDDEQYRGRKSIDTEMEDPNVRKARELGIQRTEQELAANTPEAKAKTDEDKRQRDAAFAEDKARRDADRKLLTEPLGEAMAERVSNLNTIVTFVNEVGAIRQNNFTGPVAGYEGAIRQFTGNITKDETQFRMLLKDAKDLLARARSGAAITESEQKSLDKILPTVSDKPNVFLAKLEQFGKNVETLRDEKVQLATTPRGKLLETMPRVGAPAQATTAPRALTESDIQTTMQSSGKTRQEVIDAAKAKGYQVP